MVSFICLLTGALSPRGASSKRSDTKIPEAPCGICITALLPGIRASLGSKSRFLTAPISQDAPGPHSHIGSLTKVPAATCFLLLKCSKHTYKRLIQARDLMTAFRSSSVIRFIPTKSLSMALISPPYPGINTVLNTRGLITDMSNSPANKRFSATA